jgi:formylglycine-generating enzyme required for sulfatase activity
MRLLPLILLLSPSWLIAAEPAYPLWDGQESVEQYAKKVNLPPTQTIDLGSGVNLELVLIPAGKFIMGTPEPTPVDEDGFHKRILTGQVLLAVSGVALLVMLVVVIVRAVRKKQRPKYSLLWLLAMTVAAGGCVLSGVHWSQLVKGLEQAKLDFIAAKARFDSAVQYEKPAHAVTLTQPFYMGKYDVTQEQYQQVVGTNPSNFKGKDNPVEQVSWDEAQTFCKKLTEQTKQTARLPTEAEWEYSCRAGTTTTYYSGDSEADLARVAWYSENSEETTYSVGQKEPNAFGLYDMHGNVWQWCQDRYADDYYGKSVAENPQGPAQGTDRVMRGGSWFGDPVYCRSASRLWHNPDDPRWRVGDNFLGFRVLVSPASTQP